MPTFRPYDAADNTNTSYGCWNNIMCPWKVGAIQNSDLSKRFLDSKNSTVFPDSKNSTVSDFILLLVEKLYSDDPYKKCLQYHYHNDLIKYCQG